MKSVEALVCEKCGCGYYCGTWPSACPYCENEKLQKEIERLRIIVQRVATQAEAHRDASGEFEFIDYYAIPPQVFRLLESVQAKMKVPKRGSPEWWDLRSDWAEWAAEDADGCDYEFEEKPSVNEKLGDWVVFGGNHEFINQDQPNPGWRNSLIRRPFRWQEPTADTPVDTLVWARDGKHCEWKRRHYSSPRMCWNSGTTSFTMADEVPWSHIVLANPEHPGMEPPLDWEPSNAK